MKLIFAIVSVLTSAYIVEVSNKCSCSQLLSQSDCSSSYGCKWNTPTSHCQDVSSYSLVTGYCQTITNSAQCAQTRGCAYYDKKCQIFAGCSSYSGVSDTECQTISTFCNSDGVQYCLGGLCTSFTTSTECLQKHSMGGSGKCIWENSKCREQKCTEADKTLNTDAQCNTFIVGCVTNGSGCQTSSSVTTTISSTCLEAPKSYSTNTACRGYQSGCVTNGAGCMASPFTCDNFLTSAACLQDSLQQPCLWHNNQCQQYYQCEDLKLTSQDSCQAISKYCKSDTTKCISIQSCSSYKQQEQCTIGIEGSCSWESCRSMNTGYLVITNKCQKFNDICSARCRGLDHITDSDCKHFSPICYLVGEICTQKMACSSYHNQEECKYDGLDGKCYYSVSDSQCRQMDCSDLKITTHQGCYDYNFGRNLKCTTDGKSCISLQSSCVDYQNQMGCVITNDGSRCLWENNTCTLATCSDYGKLKNINCSDIPGCATNETTCTIYKKNNCAAYQTSWECKTGGKDGNCAFNESSGKCLLFSKCSDANTDMQACNSKSETCLWTDATSTGANDSSCSNHTCDTLGMAKCAPIPNFDGSQYTICSVVENKCSTVDPSTFEQNECYKLTKYTYSWSEENLKCTACLGAKLGSNNSSTSNTSNTTNPADDFITKKISYHMVGYLFSSFLIFQFQNF